MILFLALACAPEEASSFEAYDPSAAVASSPETVAAPVETMREYATISLTDPPLWKAPAGGKVVGLTTPTTGRWTYPGVEPGFAAGEAACKAMGATHVCDATELQAADRQGVLVGVPLGTMIWSDLGDNQFPGEFSDADTCRSYSYEGADAAWNGTRISIESSTATNRLKIVNAPPSLYDETCLRDLTACAKVVPSGYECNSLRSIPCCR